MHVPPAADAPHGPADTAEDRLLQPYFCVGCRSGLTALEPPLCTCCGVMFTGRAGESHLCGRCLEQPPPFRRARSALVYDRAVVDVVHCFKYREKTQLARPLGMLLYRAFLRFWEEGEVDLVLPVPLHGRRLRQRGFNQAGLLAMEWRRHSEDRKAAVAAGLLVRLRPTPFQAGLRRREREGNIRGAFALRDPKRIDGRRLLLVDDVITTGATAGECARLLLAHGAAHVDVLTLARAL
jgi:ComF family protein